MLRYLYPLVILGLAIVFCRCMPLSFPADSPFGGMLLALSGIGITVVWPFFIGNRLHELSWRKLAQQLDLPYKPYGTGGEKSRSARVEGIYHGRELRLATRWAIVGLRRRSWAYHRLPISIDYAMSMKLKVDVPARFKMEIRNRPRFGADPRFAELPKIANAQFDRCLVLVLQPDFVVKVLTETDLADQLAQIVRRSRPTIITLRNGELLFEEKSSLFLGAESDIDRLRQIIGVMCDLAEAIEKEKQQKESKQPKRSRPDFSPGKNIVVDEDIKTVADLEYYYQLPLGFEYQQEEGIPVIVRVEDGAKFSFLIEANMLTFDEPHLLEDGRTVSKTTEVIKRGG